jgi:hypothetical protein
MSCAVERGETGVVKEIDVSFGGNKAFNKLECSVFEKVVVEWGVAVVVGSVDVGVVGEKNVEDFGVIAEVESGLAAHVGVVDLDVGFKEGNQVFLFTAGDETVEETHTFFATVDFRTFKNHW